MSVSCTSAPASKLEEPDSKLEEPESKLEEPESKRLRLDESDLSESEAETIYSYQGYETAIVRDSGDDWSPAEKETSIHHHPWCNGNCRSTNVPSTNAASTIQAAVFQVGEEYEIASDSDSNSSMSTDSSLGVEDCVLPIIAAAAASDAGFFADTSDVSFSDEELIIRYSPLRPTHRGTSPDSDPAVLPADKWKCVVCNRVNTPKMRYCNACYQVRKGWLPARPKRRVRNRRKAEREARGSGSRTTSTVINSLGADSIDQDCFMDVVSEEPSEDVVDGPMGNGEKPSEEVPQPSCSQESQPSTSQASAPSSQESGGGAGPIRSGRREFLCENCGMRPCNGGFLHGLTSHVVYCYCCSKRMWRARRTCPVCRRTIQQVIKIFVV